MKILYITNSIGMGGASVALLNILPHLIKSGIEPYVLYPRYGEFSSKLNELEIKNNILYNPLEIYPKINGIKSFLKFPYRLIKLILNIKKSYYLLCKYVEDFKPDIIHTNVGPIHIGYKVAKRYNIPHVWHIREYQIEDFSMYPFPSMKKFKKYLHNNDNRCICITKNIFNHFLLDTNKDIVIYDGVINKNHANTFYDNKQPYILFAGRLSDAKGLKDLIKVYNKYVKDKGIYDLYIAGNGEQTYIEECKSLLEESILSKVHFLGEQNHDNIYKLMYHASIFVVPSKNEGFGFITAEAMFNGTIVIGKNTGGTKEQFDNGLKLTGKEIGFRYNNEIELLNILYKCQNINKKEYEEITQRAKFVVCKLYDVETQTNKIIQLYKNIIIN